MSKQHFSFTLLHETEDGLEIEYDVDAQYVHGVDKNYGADADGNRGMRVEFREDLQFEVFLKGANVTAALPPALLAEIDKAAGRRMDEHRPERGDDRW